MQTHGLVSIITPSYNCAAFISETIEAIQAQTYTDWELLITDDCSTDNSIEIINRYADNDPRIILIRLKQNSGAGVARNHAIDCAKGQYIAFCDSDDRWFPEKLEKQISLMKSKGIALCYSSYMTCNEKGDINGIIVAPKKISYNDILKDDSMGFLTCIYDATITGKIHLPTIRKRQDWGLKIKLLKQTGTAIGILQPLAIYRLRRNSISNKKLSLIKYNVGVYRSVLNYGFLRAWCKFLFVFMPHYLVKRLRIKITNR